MHINEPNRILDWGCGTAKIPGALGMDNAAVPGVDFVHDLMDLPYPFQDQSADEIYLNHIIEHFAFSDNQRILSEAQRVLRSHGIVHIRVPHIFTVAAWADPTHKSTFAFISGEFFDVRAAKAYYLEFETKWELLRTSAAVTWFNWKRFRLRQLDSWLSAGMANILNWLLKMSNWPGAADLLVKTIPMFFVEIRWDLRKVS